MKTRKRIDWTAVAFMVSAGALLALIAVSAAIGPTF